MPNRALEIVTFEALLRTDEDTQIIPEIAAADISDL